MALTREALLKTADAFLSAYNGWTVESILSIRSPSCIHRLLPADDSRPNRNNAEFGAFLEAVIPIFRGFKFSIVDEKDTIVDVEARKVLLHLKSTAQTDVGPYNNEYIFVLTVSEDGEKVDEIVEFLDSEYTAQFLAKVAAANAGPSTSLMSISSHGEGSRDLHRISAQFALQVQGAV